MDKYEINKYLELFKTNLTTIKNTINPSFIEEQLTLLNDQISQVDFWNDQAKATKTVTLLSSHKEKLANYEALEKGLNDLLELIEIAELEDSEEANKLVEESLLDYDNELQNQLMDTYLASRYDDYPAILDIHPGAGGTESMDWAEMLLRMYQRFAQKEKFKLTFLDYQAGEEAGCKSVTLQITGKHAFGLLKGEKGVHRLVRISPFDSNSRRHTSFASVDVSPLIEDAFDIKINDEDIRVDVFHSSGAGGQSVNTTDSAVRITHKPSGIVVSCQNERSQLMNKEQALRILKSKLMEKEQEKHEAEMRALKGDNLENAFGSQIRSYVFCPYTLVKDHRTGEENSNVGAVMDGDIKKFIFAYLVKKAGENND